MTDGPRLLKLPETERSTVGIKLPRDRRPAKRDKVDDPALPWKASYTAARWQEYRGNTNWKNYYS